MWELFSGVVAQKVEDRGSDASGAIRGIAQNEAVVGNWYTEPGGATYDIQREGPTIWHRAPTKEKREMARGITRTCRKGHSKPRTQAQGS